MASRDKRSVSLPVELAAAADEAARESGLSLSAWLAEAADLKLRLQAGHNALAEWEVENGPLTPEERASGRDRARRLLGREVPATRQTA